MDDREDQLKQNLGEVRIKKNEQLTFHTFSKSTACCEYFYIATTGQELINGLNTALDLKLPYFVFGNGTKILISKNLKGLTIRNRTALLKIAGVKGKISQTGLGVEEMFVEADSGVSLQKLNEFLSQNHLQEISGVGFLKGTIGGTLILDPELQSACQSVTVWEEGTVSKIKVNSLRRNKQVILSAIFKFKAKR